MPFIPHTKAQVDAMLSQIGLETLEDLFQEIPESLRVGLLEQIPEGLNEMQLNRLVEEKLNQDNKVSCFAGGGAYEHHIPAAVWDLVMRGEFLTAYTPYQAEASQGTLQLLFEYQTMMASIMGHPISNASLYDGASGLVEAVLMACRIKRHDNPCVFVPEHVPPTYRATLESLTAPQGIKIVWIPYSVTSGRVSLEALEEAWHKHKTCTALIVPQPNYFGVLEEVDVLTDWGHDKDALVVGLCNPLAMNLLSAPGSWGQKGADIACGEGQPMGVPLNRGGPYFGFLTCKERFVRQIPGRLVGLSEDTNGQRAFTLTLQAREQHIRRSKATSNICTNQGLLVTAATIHMSLLGPAGLKDVATVSHQNAIQLKSMVEALPQVSSVFQSPFMHEFVIKTPLETSFVIDEMMKKGILAGIDVSHDYPEFQGALMVCVTETKTQADLEHYTKALSSVLEGH